MTVDPTTAAGSSNYQGETYYFCSVHYRHKFEENPEAFLTRSAPATPTPVTIQRVKPDKKRIAADKPNFTCPMHPEVSQSASGNCPKCGMALEPEFPVQPTEKTEYTCPMHPEIIRDAPGSCPICGMALEPRVVSLEEPENPELTDMRRRFWLCAALTIPVFVIGMSDLIPGAPLVRLTRVLGVDPATPGDPDRRLGGMTVLCTRLAVGSEPQPKHVHLDRIGCGSRISFQRSGDNSSRHISPFISRPR